MAQHDYIISNATFPATRTDINNALSAIQTTNSGTSRPTGAVAGQLWLDTTSATTPTLKYYDGADDISLATIDHVGNTVNWLDSTVSITGLSTTATATVLTLSDSVNTTTVNLIIDNQKEIRFRETTANGTNYISLSAPASLSADVTYTLPVAPTLNNQALISSTAGVMSFTPYAFPASDGTANQFLKTNGSGTLSFSAGGGFSGATTTSSAVDITLTSASTQVQNVTMTASDKFVILPDATTLATKGSPIYVLNNQGAFAFTIKNNSGAFITTVNSASNIFLTLNDNSTSAGVWSSSATNFNLSWGTYADVITGTKGNLDIGSCSQNKFFLGISASKISSTSAIVCYQKGTSTRDVYGVVISYSGSTITVNSETLLYSGSSTAATNANVLMLDSTSGFVFVSRASNSVVVPFTISGTTITAGTTSSTFGVGTYNDSTSTPLGDAIAMTSTIALLTESNSTTVTTFTFRTITHNGSSAPTIGTASSAVTTVGNYTAPALAKIDATNAFVVYQAATTAYTVARVVTISGSSAPTLQTANTSGVNNTGSRGIITISSTKFNVLGGNKSEVYTVSGTTVSYVGVNNTNSVFGDNSVHASLGNYVLSLAYNGTSIAFLEVVNDYAYYKGFLSPDKSYYMRAYGNFSTALVLALDSTTAFGITNNVGSTTISATVIKYIGI